MTNNNDQPMNQPINLPAHGFLDVRQISYEKLTFSPETEKGAANVAQALGYRESQMVKTLVFESAAGEQVLVMLGGDKNAVSGNLKRAIGSRDIKLAALEKVIEVTGYAIGSIPPFHWQPSGFRTFIDASLMDEDILGVGAGTWGQEIMILPAELVRVTGATVVNLSVKQAQRK
ncbi:MAG: YbaK/EbsC family protein [Dehalococcoidia bacterium]|nr:YbaK/EbsC family protein [Dehalococcoidia bacterium]